jgi:outer membrane lipoprotein SlyB
MLKMRHTPEENFMRSIHNLACWTFPLLSMSAFLSGCAGLTLPAPTAQTSSLQGRFETGTVISVRNVNSGDGNDSVNQILGALGQTPITGWKPAVEIVIRRRDNTVTSIIQPQQAGQPEFVPGESVAIVEAAATVVRPE